MEPTVVHAPLSPSGRSPATAPGPLFDAVSREAWILEPPAPDEIPHVLRDEAGLLLDRLLTTVARGRSALDVAIGEGLASLEVGDRVLQLGYSSIRDYARERLGIGARLARSFAQLARGLRERPVLREAVRSGEVSTRKALAVLPVARRDAEAEWVARARTETVRALEAGARAAGAPPEEKEEPWERVFVSIGAASRAKLDEALELAGKILGPAAPKWQRLEVICQEFLGEHPVELEPGDEGDEVIHAAMPDWMEQAKEWLEKEHARWSFLARVDPVPSPGELDEESDPLALDAELCRLADMRAGWDELVGHLAMLFRMVGLWRDAQFLSFGHYCEERLGMAPRTVEQRISLARRLYWLPGLREALRAGEISYEKARLVADVADVGTLAAWMDKAGRMTCIELRREAEAYEQAQMCARNAIDLRIPRNVRILLGAAFRAARKDGWITADECIARIADHFVQVWKDAPSPRKTVSRKVRERDGWRCRVPGCSRPALQSHHVEYRSRGGGDELWNQTGLCLAHHLHGVHMGYVKVEGVAPHALVWSMVAPPRWWRPAAASPPAS